MKKEIKIALLMGISLFMEMLDSTIVTTALPEIKMSLQITAANASLIISLYMISLAIFVPLSGWLAKKYGNKKIWMTSVLLFILSSLGSGLAVDFYFLLAMRLFQGFSGALMLPTARLVVLEDTKPKDLLRMISYVIWPALIAPAIAPFMGGLISTYLSWRWIFMINLPIGISLLLIGSRLLSNQKKVKIPETKFDWKGFLLISVASSSLLAALDMIAAQKELKLVATGLIIICCFTTFWGIKHLLYFDNPLFSLAALRFPSFEVSQFGGSVLWLSVGAIPYLSTIYFQNAFQWSPIKTGMYVLIIFVGNIGIKPFTNPIIEKIKFKYSIIFSCGLILLTSISLGLIHSDTSPIIISLILLLSGIGRSLALTSYNGMSMVEVPFQERNSANTFGMVTQNLFQGIGISLVTILFSVMNIFISAIHAYQGSFFILGIIILVPLFDIARQKRDIGMEIKQ